MADQAEKLRRMVERLGPAEAPAETPDAPAPAVRKPLAPPASSTPSTRPRVAPRCERKTAKASQPATRLAHVIAVTSGKGGVGKSSLAVGLGMCLRRLGKKVTLVDMDLGLANLDLMLGLNARHTLADVITGRRGLSDITVEGPLGIRLVPGASGVAELCNLSTDDRANLVGQLAALEATADVLIVDTGAGVSENVLTFCGAAGEAMVVATSDPASIADAYATVKLLGQRGGCPPLGLVMNMVRTRDDIQRIGRIIPVARKFHRIAVRNLGTVPYDESVGKALHARRPYIERFPESKVSLATMALARTVSTGAGPWMDAAREPFFRRALKLLGGRREAASK